MSSVFSPSREAALSRLEEFVPNAGSVYAEKRNYDFGPTRRDNVSGLSPYLSHRLTTEREVIEAVLEKHKVKGKWHCSPQCKAKAAQVVKK